MKLLAYVLTALHNRKFISFGTGLAMMRTSMSGLRLPRPPIGIEVRRNEVKKSMYELSKNTKNTKNTKNKMTREDLYT
jgi:hypothetical protein